MCDDGLVLSGTTQVRDPFFVTAAKKIWNEYEPLLGYSARYAQVTQMAAQMVRSEPRHALVRRRFVFSPV